MEAFAYPGTPHCRRHGPRGYKSVVSYRPWLRDEFAFRCVYCLEREPWGHLIAGFDVEHFDPVSVSPGKALDYENLVYSCRPCNVLKGSAIIPDPLKVLLSDAVRVFEDGRIEGATREAQILIDIIGLDDPVYRQRRALINQIVSLASAHDSALYRTLLGFPEDLPDLSRCHPPENLRKKGVADSWFARREEGSLPEVY